jgi:flagellar hook-length control protein FliK
VRPASRRPRASLVVRLDPPELGPVLVRLTVHDGRVDVHLRATEAGASGGLLHATAEVRSTLREHGLDLSSFDVQTGGEPAERQDRQDRSDRPGSSPDRRNQRSGGSADNPTGAAGARARTASDGPAAGTWL